jgi:hypothetical protein
MAAGLESSLDGANDWARVGHRVEPDADWVGHASRRYDMFQRLVAVQGIRPEIA